MLTIVQRVVITSSMVAMCGDQRATNPDHVWCEEDWNDNPGVAYSKGKTLSERGKMVPNLINCVYRRHLLMLVAI